MVRTRRIFSREFKLQVVKELEGSKTLAEKKEKKRKEKEKKKKKKKKKKKEEEESRLYGNMRSTRLWLVDGIGNTRNTETMPSKETDIRTKRMPVSYN